MRCILIAVLLPTLAYSQPNYLNQFEQNDITLGYYKTKSAYDYRLIKNKHIKNNVLQLCFFDTFKDSISIYLNDILVTSKWLSPSAKYKITSVILNLKGNESSRFMVVLHNARKYIECPIDNRFRFVELHYSLDTINELDYWNVNFTNNVPHRD